VIVSSFVRVFGDCFKFVIVSSFVRVFGDCFKFR